MSYSRRGIDLQLSLTLSLSLTYSVFKGIAASLSRACGTISRIEQNFNTLQMKDKIKVKHMQIEYRYS